MTTLPIVSLELIGFLQSNLLLSTAATKRGAMRFCSLLFIYLIVLCQHSNVIAQSNNTAGTTALLSPQSPLSAPAIASSAVLSNEEEFLPVEQAYVLNVELEGNNQPYTLRLNWQIANGYYLYRHGFKFALNTADNQPILFTPQIPSGKAKDDDYFGRVEVYYHNVDIELKDIPLKAELILTVTSQGCADAGLCYPPRTQYFSVDSSTGSVTAIDKNSTQTLSPPTADTSAGNNQAPPSLLYMLLLAVMGGTILNLMPCVFPVLSLKILSFANDKEHNKIVHGSVYSAGVILSFIAVAAILISLQAAGEAVGWGFHLQSPWFVAALAYLFFVMGLSLSGFIEFGGQWMNTGSTLAKKPGYSGSFFTGVLATVVASPCTAPFMGTALGFAVTQPTAVALSVFAALGVGMSLPVLLLSCSSKLLDKIPKPGLWMVRLKEFLAFPLYATAIWLCWVVGKQSGVNAMAIILSGCTLMTLALWLWGNGYFKRILSVGCTALAISLLTSPFLLPTTNTLQSKTADNWQIYSPELLSQLRQQGKPVFINITADWCITCLANEKVTLNTKRVKQALLDSGVTYLKGDWTNYDATITQLLNQYERTGIPLYLVYPSDKNQNAIVLPQILTTDLVIDALIAASH